MMNLLKFYGAMKTLKNWFLKIMKFSANSVFDFSKSQAP
jgi:hypothetical protein